MNESSKVAIHGSGFDASLHKSRAGGVKKSKPFDPTAWYVCVVKGRNELRCRQVLNDLTHVPYKVEAYVASWKESKVYANRTRKIIEHIIIPGRIFIRVEEQYRQDVLKQCLFLSRYMMDPSSNPTESGSRAFARVPDWEMQRLHEILELADNIVEYSDTPPKTGDRIQVLCGRFRSLKGTVFKDADGRKYATVILDNLGCFKFRLPITDIGKIK